MKTMSEGFEMIQDIFKLRWVPEILIVIGTGKERYNEILKAIGGISNTELNRKLALLVSKEALIKESNQSKNSYRLSQFGKDLEHVFKHFEEMSIKYTQRLH